MEVQRMVCRKSDLATVDDGPGSIAKKLFRLIAIGIGVSVFEMLKGGATEKINIQRQTMNSFRE